MDTPLYRVGIGISVGTVGYAGITIYPGTFTSSRKKAAFIKAALALWRAGHPVGKPMYIKD